MNSMRIEMSPRMQLQLKLAPRMIQSMEILQLPIALLQERIEHEMEENPLLERNEKARTEQDEPGEEAAPAEDTFDPDGPLVHDADSELDFKRLEALDKDWDGHFNEEHRVSRIRNGRGRRQEARSDAEHAGPRAIAAGSSGRADCRLST